MASQTVKINKIWIKENYFYCIDNNKKKKIILEWLNKICKNCAYLKSTIKNFNESYLFYVQNVFVC